MIELYIDGRLADWDSDTSPITLCKEFEGEDEMSRKETLYSYELELPATLTNNAILGHKNSIEVDRKFSDTHGVELYDGGAQLFKGNLLLTEITKDAYTCNLYATSGKGLGELFGDRKMSEITPHLKFVGTMDDVDHINSYHIGRAYEVPLDDDHIVFPYILYNRTTSKTRDGRNDYQEVGPGTLYSDENSYPIFNLKSVMRDLFSSYGFEVTGNFFTDKEFESLYQTVQNTKWNSSERQTPALVEIRCRQYRNGLSQSAYAMDDPNYNMRIGVDDLFKSGENFTSINDTNDMFSGSYISVPKTGWYRIQMGGNAELSSTRNGYYDNTERGMRFASSNAAGDPTDLRHNPLEIALKKRSEDRGYVSRAMGEFAYQTDEETTTAPTWSKGDTLDRRTHTFPVGGGTMKVDDQYTIIGARFGSYRGKESDTLRPNRRHKEGNLLNLIDPTKVTDENYYTIPYSTDKSDQYDVRWNMSHWFQDREWRDDFTYAENTALAFAGNGVIFNQRGEVTFDALTGVFTTTQAGRVSESLAYNEVTPAGLYGGSFDLDVLAYLKKGDLLETTLTNAFTNGDNLSGIAQVTINDFSLTVALVNTEDEYWRPGLDTPLDFGGRKPTNVNLFLGDTKCKEWVDNICKTFNLKISKTSSNTYSVDKRSRQAIDTGVVGLDSLAHPDDAKFIRIDSPSSYNFKWTVNEDEEGYRESGKDGGKTYENPAGQADPVEIDSKYSYDWFKKVEFEGLGDRMVPVIAPSKRFEETYTFEKALVDGDWTEGKERLMYVPHTAEIISEAYLPLLIPEGGNASLTLDFDSISDKLFNVVFPNQYEVEIDCYLPQSDWSNIGPGTRARLNGNLYTISKVDGYSVGLDEKCTITLRSLA